MKLLLLKTLLLRKHKKDEGFTLPIVIAIGFVMVLLSAVDLVQSGEENLNALSQLGSSDALAVAELGVARYRDLLNNNRVLAVNNLDQWTSLSTETCEAIVDTGDGWANNNNDTAGSGYVESMWRAIEVDETVAGSDLNGDGDATDTEAEIGRYKIVDYVYDNTANVNDNGVIDLTSDAANNADGIPPTGTLTVQGRDRIGSIAQLQVTIPIGVNTQDLEDLNPALWIQQDTVANLGSVNVNDSNIVFYRPSGAGKCDNPADIDVGGTTQTTISDSRQLPPLTTTDSLSFAQKNTLTLSSGENVLGIVSDNQNGERYYFEHIGDLTINSGTNIKTDGEAKVIIYVSGKLTINDSVNITNSSNAATSQYLEIHVGGDVEIKGSGTVDIKGLIHAPNGEVKLGGTGDVNITGSIFANSWDNTRTGTVNITTDDYKFYSVTPNRTPAPLTFRPSQWERQEANNF